MVETALSAAKGLTAVTASTTQYSVWHETDPKDVWHANQGMVLRSRDGGGLLTLVGTLQQDGLAVGDLGWQLSPAAAETRYEQALRKAVDLLTEPRGDSGEPAPPQPARLPKRHGGRGQQPTRAAHRLDADDGGRAGRLPRAA